jgi:hypothetical protein
LCVGILWPISFYVSRWNILNNDIRIPVPLCSLVFEIVLLLKLCISDSLIHTHFSSNIAAPLNDSNLNSFKM